MSDIGRRSSFGNSCMNTRYAVAKFALFLAIGLGLGQAEAATGKAVFDRTAEIVKKEFYRPSELGSFDRDIAAIRDEAENLDEKAALDTAIDRMLAALKTSHTARYTPDEVDYYELLDVFRYNYRNRIRDLYPPEGEITYEGIGIATKEIDGKLFVTDVYDGGPAARANVKAGDEVVSADGAPFAAIGSFKGKTGKEVALTLRRKAHGPEMTIRVRVEKLQPSEALLEAIEKSVRVFDRGGKRIGYVRIWSYTREEVGSILNRELGGGKLANIDGLVLDLRSRWGGAPADAGEVFVGGTPDMEMIERDGDVTYVNTRFDKPIVAIIDEGTRSGMEIMAAGLKKNGIELVGMPTAGAVVGGRGFLLPDDSLLVLAVVDVTVDGKRIEGDPVDPDKTVPFDIRHADGADPQLDAAVEAMSEKLSEG
jgi:carboxyl-terminal processing protease